MTIWLTLVILATPEAEIRRIAVKANSSKDPVLEIHTKKKKGW
jgi:hypothetical protein